MSSSPDPERAQVEEALAEWNDPEAHPLENVEGMTAILNAALKWTKLPPTDMEVTACGAHGWSLFTGDSGRCEADEGNLWPDAYAECEPVPARLYVERP